MMSDETFSVPNSNNFRGTLVQPHHPYSISNPNPTPNPNSSHAKRKRSLPGTPDPDAEVIALSPKSLMATNRFVCEICRKGFQREQNLQLHRRGHNLPWKLKQKSSEEAAATKKKVYVCPERSCVHHDPSRALGDLTGIKKHFSRKHGEKKWKCHKCSKDYAVQSDCKAHSKICGTRQYKCECATIFTRKDSFMTHRAFCEVLAEQSARVAASLHPVALLSNLRNPVESQSSTLGNINLEDADEHGQKMNFKLPLWLVDHHQTNSSVTRSMPDNLVQTVNMFEGSSSLPWLNNYGGYQEAPSSPFASDNILLSMPQGVKREEFDQENTGGEYLLSRSASSFYSNSNVSSQNTLQPEDGRLSSCHHMSLQRATQMESTHQGGGLNDDINVLSFNNNIINSNNYKNVFGGFTVSSESNGANGGGGEFSLIHEQQLGLTRDFLGVGDHDSLDLAKFNPMGSLMNLQNHFAGHH